MACSITLCTYSSSETPCQGAECIKQKVRKQPVKNNKSNRLVERKQCIFIPCDARQACQTCLMNRQLANELIFESALRLD